MMALSKLYRTRASKGLRRNCVVEVTPYLEYARGRGSRIRFRYVVVSRHFTQRGAEKALTKANGAA